MHNEVFTAMQTITTYLTQANLKILTYVYMSWMVCIRGHLSDHV